MIHKSKVRDEVYRLRTVFHIAGVPTTPFKGDKKGFTFFETDYIPEALEDYLQVWRVVYTEPIKNRIDSLARLAALYRESSL